MLVMVGGRFISQLFSQLVLLLLLVECLDNTLLLLLDGLLPRCSASAAVVNYLPARIFLIVLVTRISGPIVLVLLIVQPQPLSLEPILVSLLAERLNYTLLLLLDRWLSFHHLLVLDNDVHRVVRIARRIVLNNLLRVVMVRAVVQPRYRYGRRRSRRVH